MVGLKFVRLFLVHPMPPSVYLHLIRTRKHLAYFEVYCERSGDQCKEQLSAFKKQVIKCLENELGYKDAVFKMQTFCENGLHLVRYVMKRNGLAFDVDNVCPIDAQENDHQRVFTCVAHSKGFPVQVIQG